MLQVIIDPFDEDPDISPPTIPPPTPPTVTDPPTGTPPPATPPPGTPPFMLTATPQIRVRSRGKVPTGISAQFAPQFRVIRDPIVIPDPSRLIQVTDLVGLKRT